VAVTFGFLRSNWAENTKILLSAFAELPYTYGDFLGIAEE
jgi:hypothetical protein